MSAPTVAQESVVVMPDEYVLADCENTGAEMVGMTAVKELALLTTPQGVYTRICPFTALMGVLTVMLVVVEERIWALALPPNTTEST